MHARLVCLCPLLRSSSDLVAVSLSPRLVPSFLTCSHTAETWPFCGYRPAAPQWTVASRPAPSRRFADRAATAHHERWAGERVRAIKPFLCVILLLISGRRRPWRAYNLCLFVFGLVRRPHEPDRWPATALFPVVAILSSPRALRIEERCFLLHLRVPSSGSMKTSWRPGDSAGAGVNAPIGRTVRP